jgi:hypothetical protein
LDADAHPDPFDTEVTDHLGRVRRDLADDVEAGEDGPLRVVLVSADGAEDGEDAVPDQVFHGAPKALDGHDHAGDAAPDDVVEVLRIQPFAQRGRPDGVGEQRGDDTPLLAHLAAGPGGGVQCHRPEPQGQSGPVQRGDPPSDTPLAPPPDTREGL